MICAKLLAFVPRLSLIGRAHRHRNTSPWPQKWHDMFFLHVQKHSVSTYIWSRPAAGNPPRWYPPPYMYILYMYICIYTWKTYVYIYIHIYLDTYVSPLHTYIHYITLHYITLHYITLHTYIHTCLYLPTYVGTHILHPTHRTGGGRGSRGTLHDSWIPGR